jgi:stage V sporulation protein D (sporulation-specific penicillin-binding protein)
VTDELRTGPKGAKMRSTVRPGTQRRIEWTFYLVLMPLFFLTGRLVQLQALGGSGKADFIQEKKQILPPRRADILAADGTAMAVTLDEYAVCVNPRAVKQKEKMARLVAEYIGGGKNTYMELLQKTERSDGKPNYYVRLAKNIDEARINKMRKRMGPPENRRETRAGRKLRKDFWSALTFEPSPRRTYPLGNFASQLIGFTTQSGSGVDGLERSYEGELSGEPGEIVSQVDAQGRPIPGFVQKWTPPTSGLTLMTTIDPEIQADADAAMQSIVAKYKPNFAVAVVMRPKTGEILAMATAPSFNLNKRPSNIAELATNRVTQFAYEPGSTFKVITAAAAIENVPDWRNHSFYCAGVQRVGKHNMHCWVNSTSQRQHGQETLSESIRDSCNFGVYGFARLAGKSTMLRYAENFGIGDRIDVDGLRGPRVYVADGKKDWSPEQLANFSFGQGMTLTPLQLTRVISTIANDGVMMKPMLIKEMRDESGKVVKSYLPEVDKRVIAPETAQEVRKMMERVMAEGSARKLAFVPGYKTAGKTGSAQKAIGRRGYADGKFISSLAGFVPSVNPEFAVIVLADEPHGSHWGSEVCGPAWAEIASKAMLHLRLKQGASAPAPDPSLMTLTEKPSKPAGDDD